MRPNRFKRLRHRDVVFIASWEGFTACPAHFDFDPPGVNTVGYGHTTGVVLGGPCISHAEGLRLLRQDARVAVRAVKHEVKVPLSKNQFSALVSFVYNVGPGAFATSNLLAQLNRGRYQGAAREFQRWVNGANGPLPGLIRRRRAEARLFRSK